MSNPTEFSHRFLLFAGTTEGRLAAEYLAALEQVFTRVCVATSYGKDLMLESIENQNGMEKLQKKQAGSPHFSCSDERIAEDGMEQLIREQMPDLVIDATHPYAKEVTENIQEACNATHTRYLRVLREEGMSPADSDCISVPDLSAAVEFLSSTEGNILAATGSKELAVYARIPQYQHRVFPRVLPLEGVVEKCISLGFSPKNLICMQGPFSEALNTALLCQIQANFLVTKDSGDTGGFSEKLSAARKANCRMVVVQRPKQPDGVSLSQLFQLLSEEFGLPQAAPSHVILPVEEPQLPPEDLQPLLEEPQMGTLESEKLEQSKLEAFTSEIREEPQTQQFLALPKETDHFPLFVRLKDKSVLVVGGGRIALRRINTLLLFADRVQVIAEQPSQELLSLVKKQGSRLRLQSRSYQEGDCADMELVVAATDRRQVNHKIFRECRNLNIPVNVADCPKECSFYFPGVVKDGSLVIGVTAGGTDHSLAAKTVRTIRETLAT